MAARLTGDTSDDSHLAGRATSLDDESSGGSHPAVPALDAEILTAVRALNTYPKRSKDKTQDLLAMRIAKRWLDLLPSTREKLQALQKSVGEELQGGRGIKRQRKEGHAEPNSGGSGSDTNEHNTTPNVFMGRVRGTLCPFCPKHFEDKCALVTHLALLVGAPYKSKWPHLTDISAIFPGPKYSPGAGNSDTEIEESSPTALEDCPGDGGGTGSSSGKPNSPNRVPADGKAAAELTSSGVLQPAEEERRVPADGKAAAELTSSGVLQPAEEELP